MENKYKLWVAIDKSGEVFAYISKPKRECYLGFWYSDLNCVGSISRNFFPELKWDDEPIDVELRPVITDLEAKANDKVVVYPYRLQPSLGVTEREQLLFEKYKLLYL